MFANTINGNITSATVDATFACAEKLKSESNEQSNALGDLQDDVEDLQEDVTAVKNMLNEVRILLSTPQGLREGFPTK